MNYAKIGLAVISAILIKTSTAHADVKLPLLISNGMVLQQKTPVRIYGTAQSGEAVTVTIEGQTASTKTGADGNWEVMLKPMPAGGPYTLTVKGNNTLTVNDVLVGEVWVCSGQSNMEWSLGAAEGGTAEAGAANDPQLRMFTVPKRIAATPQTEVGGGVWQPATPQTAGGFSAVGYYFAKALRASRKVPIGMIHTSWGGTRIEAWMSRETLEANNAPATEFKMVDKNSPAYKAAQEKYLRAVTEWKAAGSPTGAFMDPGIADKAKNWAELDTDLNGWKKIKLSGAWEQSGISELANLDGAVWFRKLVVVPEALANKPMTLTLGAIDDYDTTYFNGVKIGGLGAETPNVYQVERKYTIPANLVKAGENVIAVRVWDSAGAGGLTGPDKAMRLAPDDTPTGGFALAGEWLYRIENGRPSDPGAGPDSSGDPNAATGLYNAMLAPLSRYTITGGLWYQGESNVGRAAQYARYMPAMITNWRTAFGIPNFPFLLVQLAPFGNGGSERTEYAELREAQEHTTHAIPNVGMAVITDVGNETDIHPRKKGPVGERLALLARKIAYGEKIDAISPTYRPGSLKVNGKSATVSFDNIGGGLSIHGDQLRGFTVAGADGKFYPATATIRGKDTVEVSAPEVAQPVAVRYDFVNYTVATLQSKDGLQATPFRTDAPKF